MKQTYKLSSIVDHTKNMWSFYSEHWYTYTQLILIQYIPVAVLIFITLSAQLLAWFMSRTSGPLVTLTNTVVLVSSVLAIFALAVISILVVVALIDAIAHPRKTMGELLNGSLYLLLPFLWIQLLYVVSTGLATFVFIVPGVVLSVFFLFAFFVFVNENLRGFDVFIRSYQLVRGFWFSISLRLLLLLGLLVLVLLLSAIPFLGFVFFLAAQMFLVPFVFVFVYGMYDELVDIKKKSPQARDGMAWWAKLIISLVIGVLIIVTIFVYYIVAVYEQLGII